MSLWRRNTRNMSGQCATSRQILACQCCCGGKKKHTPGPKSHPWHQVRIVDAHLFSVCVRRSRPGHTRYIQYTQDTAASCGRSLDRWEANSPAWRWESRASRSTLDRTMRVVLHLRFPAPGGDSLKTNLCNRTSKPHNNSLQREESLF